MAFLKFSKGKAIYSVPNGIGDGSAYFYKTEGVIANIDNLPYGNSARTISCWIYPTQYQGHNHTFFSYGSNNSNQRYGIACNTSGTAIDIYGHGNTTNYSYNLAINNWYHVVITFAEDYSEQCYINGVLIDTKTHSNINTIKNQAKFGRSASDSGQTDWFYGNIKELNVYNRVLSADEVTQLYNKQEITGGRVLHIPLQYGKDNDNIFTSKSFVYDYSILTTSSGFDEWGYPIRYDIASECGISYNPILVKDGLVFYAPLQEDIAPIIGNAPSLTGESVFGEVNGIKCLQCNGNTRIDYPQTDDLPTGNAPRTMSAWVSTTHVSGTFNFICGFGNDDYHTLSYCFYDGYLRLYKRDMSNDFHFVSNYPNDNTWVHALTTFDGSTLRLYANGELIYSGSVTFSTTNRSVYLGYLGTQNNFNYYGNITSFRIYNRVLTDNEIKALAKEF